MEKLVCSAAEFTQTLEDMIHSGACVPLYVSGHSMNPFLRDGRDIVWLRACRPSDFRKGQILLFKRNDSGLVLHRIKKLLPQDRLLMNGDAQDWCETIPKSQAIAVVYEIERDGKKKSCSCLSLIVRNSVWQLLKPFRSRIMAVWRKLNGRNLE